MSEAKQNSNFQKSFRRDMYARGDAKCPMLCKMGMEAGRKNTPKPLLARPQMPPNLTMPP